MGADSQTAGMSRDAAALPGGRHGAAPTAPDTGRAWVVLMAAFAAMFTVFGVAYSFGAFFDSMAAEFGSGRGATSGVYSVTAFIWFSLGMVSGPVTDRVGPRPVLVTGSVAMGAGLALTSTVGHIWLGYVTYGLGVGIGVACGYVPMVAVVGGWFERRRSMAVGIAVSGIGLGTLTVAPLAAILIDRIGWRRTYLVFAVCSFVVLLAAAALARRPPAAPHRPPGHIGAALRTRSFRLIYLSLFLMSFPLSVTFVYLPAFGRGLGVSGTAAAALVGLLGGASVVGRLGLGAVADRLGRVRTFQVATATMGVSYVIWLAAQGYPWLVSYALVMGLGYGGFIALSPAVLAELFGVRGLGAIVGALYTAAGAGALAGPPLAGWLTDSAGSYRPAIGLALVMALAAALAVLPVRPEGAVRGA